MLKYGDMDIDRMPEETVKKILHEISTAVMVAQHAKDTNKVLASEVEWALMSAGILEDDITPFFG